MRPIYVYFILVALGIPWWWPEAQTGLLLGVPQWVMSAIAVSFIASVYTLYVLNKAWPKKPHE